MGGHLRHGVGRGGPGARVGARGIRRVGEWEHGLCNVWRGARAEQVLVKRQERTECRRSVVGFNEAFAAELWGLRAGGAALKLHKIPQRSVPRAESCRPPRASGPQGGRETKVHGPGWDLGSPKHTWAEFGSGA